MKISKKDALTWMSFFAEYQDDQPLPPRQQEIVYAVFSQKSNPPWTPATPDWRRKFRG